MCPLCHGTTKSCVRKGGARQLQPPEREYEYSSIRRELVTLNSAEWEGNDMYVGTGHCGPIFYPLWAPIFCFLLSLLRRGCPCSGARSLRSNTAALMTQPYPGTASFGKVPRTPGQHVTPVRRIMQELVRCCEHRCLPRRAQWGRPLSSGARSFAELCAPRTLRLPHCEYA